VAKILIFYFGGREPAVFQIKKFLIIPFLLITTSQMMAEESSIPVPEVSEDMLKQAREVLNSVQKVQASPEYKAHQNWINQNSQRLFARQAEKFPNIDYDTNQKQLGNGNKKITGNGAKEDIIAKMLNDYRFKPDDIKKAQITHFPVMIFVSSSIPKSSLKDLMIQAKKSGAVLVFRGLIGGLKNTAKFLEDIDKDNVQAIIDPRLFDLFNIEVVPTIVVLKEANQECNNENNSCKITPIHDRISGNITLDYALETISSGKSETSLIASKFLAKIRVGGQDGKL
jgi:type-F conjugative transfer system pilin assembly protein TrbC